MAAPSSSRETADKRLPSTFVACPIVYGSIAFYLGKKAQEYQTHSWTLYVRGPQDEDLSAFVSKVAFTLHPSFAQPVREVTKAPFQITETGWGEFEAGIRIYFKDSNEQPVDLFHHLRLYPPNPAHQLNPKKPVVSENYDEIVFCNPFTKFHSMLMQYGGSSKSAAAAAATAAAVAAASSSSNATSPPLPPNPNATTTAWPEHYVMFDDAMDMEMLLSIHQHIQRELLETKRRLVDCEAQVVDAQQGYAAPAPGTSSSTKASSTKTKQSGQQKQGQKKDANANALPGDIEVKMEPGQQAKTASADSTKEEANNGTVDASLVAMDVDEPTTTAALQIAVPS